MSSVTNSDAAINAFVNAIHPNLNYIAANTAFSACLFTLAVVLLALSTKESRRRVVFRLNLFAICLALTMGIFVCLINGKAIVDPFNQVSTSMFITAVASIYFPPLLYDSILLCRLLALYPPARTSLVTLLKFFAFPFCVKCARVVVITLLIYENSKAATTTEVLVQDEANVWFRDPWLIAEWTLQISDNTYSVSLFLYNLHVRARPLKSKGGIRNRIRQVFYVSLANFIFPLVFDIAQLILVLTDHSPNTGGLLVLINNYVTVMGVMGATIWFSRLEWAYTHKEPLSDGMLRRPPELPMAPASGWMGRGEMVVIGTRALTLDP
ncbi:hypothetical protein EDD16DRAFT_1716316 [Pisolithus croceorrhizus]|nr:hypothetical protein EDD16DRAFT_1716316 [Pisolithus croceorrhizus]